MAGAAANSSFLNNLGKIYGIYTGTFAGFVIFIGILEFLGVPFRLFHEPDLGGRATALATGPLTVTPKPLRHWRLWKEDVCRTTSP